jgi:hypothetical protein
MNAYLDPGSGSMLLGLFASGLAGIVVFFKTFGHRVMKTLAFWRSDEAEASSSDAADDEGATEPAEAPQAVETGPEPEGASTTT